VAPPVPQVSGSLAVSGLSAPVRVVRDRWGVPHIYAANQNDLFVAQGLVQAQDRLFQMDLWRRAAQGRLSEVLGANFIERDAMTRRMQYRGDLAAEWASYGPDTQAIAGAFVRGINAWVDLVADRPPEEFALAGWRPEHWKADDLLNRTDAFLASANASDEVLRARLVAVLGAAQADALTQTAFASPVDVPRELDVKTISYIVGDALKAVGTPPFFSGLSAPVISVLEPDTTGDMVRRLKAEATYEEGAGTPHRQPNLAGSNAWAVAGDRSATGAPLLAADPHQALDHPSRRYLVHLNAPGWNVIGAAAPWLPGVVIGHNDHLAWATTSRAADVQDLYVEKVNPANPHQVELAGRWVDTKIIADPIAVKGKSKAFPFECESTSHGVIIASDRERHLAFTVRWTGFEPGAAAELASLAVDRAQSETELRAALDRWKLPAATFVYATRDGRIGTEAAGWVPVRTAWNGTLPAPGWTGRYEWQGVQQERDRPKSLAAEPGHVASANDSAARAHRIDRVLSASASFGVDDFKQLQHDTSAWNADVLVPLLAAVRGERADVEEARARLLTWDRRLRADSSEATLYVFWERRLLRRLVGEKLAPSLADEVAARANAVLVPAITTPTRFWFAGNPKRTRDELLLTAMADAVDALRARQADRTPAWGSLHTALFRHPLAVTSMARRRFNVGPFERPGYADTVLSTGGVDLEQTSGATFSVIVDVGNWDRSLATNAPGQSGVPASAHFADLAKPWSAGEYVPLAFGEAAVQNSAETTLTLIPQ
jgi:penicillin G amidase